MATDWSGQANAYQRSFGKLCAGAIPYLSDTLSELPMGSAILDAGCGTGTLTSILSNQGFESVGFDADEGMIGLARSRFPDVTFVVDSLPNLRFPDATFDASVANFVVNHALKPLDHVRELRRVTRNGGTVAITVWPSATPSEHYRLLGRVAQEAGAKPLSGHRLPAEDDFERSPAGLTELMTRAGLNNSSSKIISWDAEVDADDLWSGVEAGIGNIGISYLQQDEETRKSMRSAFVRLTGLGPLKFRSEAILGTGTRNY